MESETAALMPTEPDWSEVQARYLQGEALRDIAAATGATVNAIRCRASRNGWPRLRAQALTLARHEVSDEIRGCLVETLLKDARGWRDVEYPPRTDPAYDTLTKARERLAATAARVLQWDVDPLEGARPARVLDV